MSEPGRHPSSLAGQRILVVAPHPDDEALGCGGLIAELAAAGRCFHILFVTDGGASHPASRTWSRKRLAMQREREAAEALARLGAGDQPRTFLRLPDAAMPPRGEPAHAEALDRTVALVREFGPDLALLPWRRDPHCDHRGSWHLVTEALESVAAPARTLEYAIWLDELGAPADRPEPGEAELVVFDLTPEAAARKLSAVDAHLSQTGKLIDDDPTGFCLSPETIRRLTGPREAYWRIR
ncbi:PIG-L family deacetylase [Aurantimonas sp. VKM B-3413]|uniref:PIG-L deacetylase family protein n=1 Tax=Aurantimonas sp. VKM B-3413 TaxID=2779401 RepID=UPI001E4C012C|nr:PIG-L family deacetylase [Aurantimonas sp. VKM B-3413]